MNTKSVPALVMLSAGLIDCIVSIYYRLDLFSYLRQLLVVLVLFYLLGCILQFVLDIGMAKMSDKEEETKETENAGETDEEGEEGIENESEKAVDEERNNDIG